MQQSSLSEIFQRSGEYRASQALPYVGRSSRFNLVGGTNRGAVNRFAWIGWFKIGAVVYLKNRRTARDGFALLLKRELTDDKINHKNNYSC